MNKTTFFERYYWACVLALLALHASLIWLARAPGLLGNQDGATYVLLGRALRGFQYRDLWRIDAPVHKMYPPVYPALLAVWSAIGGEKYDWLVLLDVGCSVAALALGTAVLRRLCGATVALAALLVLTVNPSLVDTAGSLISEPPFILFVTIALWALTREQTRLTMVLAGTAAIAAALTRSVGVTILPVIAVYWLWQRRYRAVAIYAVAATLTVGLWLGWTVMAPDQAPGRSYVADATVRRPDQSLMQTLAIRVKSKVPYASELYWQLPAPSFESTKLDEVILVSVLGAGLLVGLLRLFVAWPAAFLYLASYGALLLIWPYMVPRFLIPLIPLVIAAALYGIAGIARVIRPRWETPAVWLLAGVLAVTGAITVRGAIERRAPCDPGLPVPAGRCLTGAVDSIDQATNIRYSGATADADEMSFFNALRYVHDHVPSNAIFLTGKPANFYYYTNRRVVSTSTALSQPPSSFVMYLRQEGVTHVLLTGLMPYSFGIPRIGGMPLAVMMKDNCDQFELEASFPPTSYLFRLPVGERPDSEASCRAAGAFLASYRHEGKGD